MAKSNGTPRKVSTTRAALLKLVRSISCQAKGAPGLGYAAIVPERVIERVHRIYFATNSKRMQQYWQNH